MINTLNARRQTFLFKTTSYFEVLVLTLWIIFSSFCQMKFPSLPFLFPFRGMRMIISKVYLLSIFQNLFEILLFSVSLFNLPFPSCWRLIHSFTIILVVLVGRSNKLRSSICSSTRNWVKYLCIYLLVSMSKALRGHGECSMDTPAKWRCILTVNAAAMERGNAGMQGTRKSQASYKINSVIPVTRTVTNKFHFLMD